MAETRYAWEAIVTAPGAEYYNSVIACTAVSDLASVWATREDIPGF